MINVGNFAKELIFLQWMLLAETKEATATFVANDPQDRNDMRCDLIECHVANDVAGICT